MKIKKNLVKFILLTLCISMTLPIGAMDQARVETRVDEAVTAFGVSGRNVIVAILDRGIDWKNNDFRNDDGSTRIKYIFDLTDNTGANAPGNPYGVGTIYTEAQINTALNGGTQLATRDAVGHGTTTTGIAAGNGRNSENRKYRGVAPNASIIMVKFTTEGAPAHNGQPAEAPFYRPELFPQAINFVKTKAAELNMPFVMLPNFGSINGPTDGTSDFARTIDLNFGANKKGVAFVNGTGDDGGMPNHAGGVIAQGETKSIQIQKNTNGVLRFDLWYGGADRFSVSIETPSGNFGPYNAPGTNTFQQVQNTTFFYRHSSGNQVYYGATNQKREIFLDISGPAGIYNINLQGTTVVNGRFDATINPSNIIPGISNTNRFLNNVVPGSIWDGATAFNNIAPNSYVIRTNWIDINGTPRSMTANEGSIGELWTGSSTGPTFDGRLGVDVSAPGDRIVTTYNPTGYFGSFAGNLIQGGNGQYGIAGAVSAAAPQVTGIIALMLEKNPQLDQIQIREMLRSSARSDAFTGATPNPVWGYGKVDAYNAVRLAAQSARKPRFDFDGDGKSDISVFRSSVGAWYIQQSTAGFTGVGFGFGTDLIAPADFDGDGKTDIAVFRPSNGAWYYLKSSDGTFVGLQFGQNGDIPIPADFDGDGKADINVFRPSNGAWYRLNSSDNSFFGVAFGQNGDQPLIADFDGDAKSDIAVFRPSAGAFYSLDSSNGAFRGTAFGFGTDIPTLGDFDGDGKTDVAVFRPSNGSWYRLNSSNGSFFGVAFGQDGDIPVTADYDGDGKSDIAVFRNGNWYYLNSSNGAFVGQLFGLGTDKPIPSAF